LFEVVLINTPKEKETLFIKISIWYNKSYLLHYRFKESLELLLFFLILFLFLFFTWNPKINCNWLASTKQTHIVEFLNCFLSKTNIWIKNLCLLKVFLRLLNYTQRNNLASLTKRFAQLFFCNINWNVINKDIIVISFLHILGNRCQLWRIFLHQIFLFIYMTRYADCTTCLSLF
jgi:hypothetical protein